MNWAKMVTSLVVGDLGNTSLRLGEFRVDPSKVVTTELPLPIRSFAASWEDLELDDIAGWLAAGPPATTRRWRLGSVNRAALTSLSQWIGQRNEPVQQITYEHFAFPIQVQEPPRVGVDRLAAAFAADRMRAPHQAAIVIDIGTAITIDCVTPAGQFIGGAIAPGMQLALASLYQGTDLLPDVELTSSPPLVGDDTSQAIRAGVYWMTVMGLKGLVDCLQHELAAPSIVVGTGGALQILMDQLPPSFQFHPDLVLSGLALAQP